MGGSCPECKARSPSLDPSPVTQGLRIWSSHVTSLSLSFPYLLTGYKWDSIKDGECEELPSTMSGLSHISSGYLSLRMSGVEVNCYKLQGR